MGRRYRRPEVVTIDLGFWMFETSGYEVSMHQSKKPSAVISQLSDISTRNQRK